MCDCLLLLNGVTGFIVEGIQQPDAKQFKTLCFTLISQNGGKIINFEEPKIATNFFNVEIMVFGQRLHLLLNGNYPFLAFASEVGYSSHNFIDMPELSKQFSPYYNVLGTKELNEPICWKKGNQKSVLQNANKLDRLELKEVAYFGARRIGEVIFNHWD